jgi:glycosyltransferase involved in cell wall biosynthesis
MQTDKQLDIVFWAFPSWSGDYLKSTVELAKELALRHRVLYIDYSYSWKDMLSRSKTDTMPREFIMGKNCGLREVQLDNGGSLFVLSLPPIIPFNWINNAGLYKVIEKLNHRICSPRIHHTLSKLQFEPAVVINAFNPFMAYATTSIFDKCPIIYYCYDNIGASHWAAKHGPRLEAEFIKNVDAVIYTSEALKDGHQHSAPGYVVSNGVDLRNFNRQALAAQVSVSSKKVIGYVGSIDDRLDYDMLEYATKGDPNKEFLFIGRKVGDHWQRLSGYANVKFTGAVEPSQLPAMMASFDIGIIPFVKNDFTKNIYPMKVNEYLALGLPVVSTDFAKLDELAPYMAIAKDSATFSTMLDTEMANDDHDKKRTRKLKAATNSWEQKALEFEKILTQYAATR